MALLVRRSGLPTRITIAWLALASAAEAFVAPGSCTCRILSKPRTRCYDQPQAPNAVPPGDNDDKNDNNEEGKLLVSGERLTHTPEENMSVADARLSDLLPPAVNFSRDSVLFSENPATERNNGVLTFWRRVKQVVPPVVTGAWPWRDPYLADENPMGAFYNICFVRLPIIAMGLVYTNNLLSGHPLIMDYGDGPFEMTPLVVYLVLAIVLV